MAEPRPEGQNLTELMRYEHDRKNIDAKKVSVWGYLPGTDVLVRISAADDGAGGYALKTSGGGGGGGGSVTQGAGASAGTAWRTIGDYAEATGTGASLNADIVPSTDVSSYKWGSIHLTGTFSATIQVQFSNDNSDWRAGAVDTISTATGALATSMTAAGLYSFPIKARYMRIRVTAYTSGTVTGTAETYAYAAQLNYMGVTANQGGTWTVGHNSQRSTLQLSTTQTANGNGTALTSAGPYNSAFVTLNCTAASGTTPTLNVKIQASDDGGTTWFDVPNGSFTQLTTTGSQAIQISNFGDTIRAAWTISGTTPSFTFAVKTVLGA